MFLKDLKDYFRSSKKRKVLFAVSLIVMCLGTVAFAKLTDDYLDRDDLYLFDKPISDFVVANRSPILNRLMVLITLTGNWQLIILGTILASLVLITAHKWRYFWVLLITDGVAEIFVESTKVLFGRARPPISEALIPQFNYSFPSGHSYFASVYYGLLIYILVRHLKSRWMQIMAGMVGIIFILLLGFSRIYLGVHWVTDVMAGLAIGGAWLGAMVLFLEVENSYHSGTDNLVENKKGVRVLVGLSVIAWLLMLAIVYQNQTKRAANLGTNIARPTIEATMAATKTAPAARSRA